jgi:hypothetical protein
MEMTLEAVSAYELVTTGAITSAGITYPAEFCITVE